MKCPHCGQLIGPVHLSTEPPQPSSDYDELNPPPIGEEARIGNSQPKQTTQNKKYYTFDVYVHAESQKALLLDDSTPGDSGTFEKDWFPKSQLKDTRGEELGERLDLGWKKTYRTVQMSEWIMQKKGVDQP